jgi:hypothetical protein
MKVFTKWLRKYHFWVLLVAVVLVALISWYVACPMTLAKEFNDNKSKIEADFGKMGQIETTERHPNDQYKEAMTTLIGETQQSVIEAWETKFEKQGDLFKWPEELGADFVNVVADLRPFEKNVPYPATEELLRINQREQYPYYVKPALRELAAIIGAPWEADEAAADPGRLTVPTEDETPSERRKPKSPITWNPANQREMEANHFDWSRQRGRVPTTLQILYAQEDLWVYTALMHIIRETNGFKIEDGKIVSQGDLPITYIDFIRIGKSARRPRGVVVGSSGGGGGAPSMPAVPGYMEGPTGMPELPPEEFFEGEEGVFEGETATPVGPDPADGRYVDMNNEPLTGVQLRGTTGEAGAEQATLAVAKRMPVHMQLRINQLAINKLLIECGNSPLTVEVQQLRFNPGGEGAARSLMAEGGYREGGMASAAESEDERYQTIELYGIISMYNRVNYEALGVQAPVVEEAEAGTEEAGDGGDATEATEPADTAAEGATPADATEPATTGESGTEAAPAPADTTPAPAADPEGTAPAAEPAPAGQP